MNFSIGTRSAFHCSCVGSRPLKDVSCGTMAMHVRKNVVRNHSKALSLSSPSSLSTKASTKMNADIKHIPPSIADRQQHTYLRRKPQSAAAASFSTNENSTEGDLSKFSMNELKQLAIQLLRQCQRKEERSTTTANRAQKILQHVIDRAARQQWEGSEPEDLSSIQTSLIDSLSTFQSSIIRDIKETRQQSDQDEKIMQHQQQLQLQRLREVCSAAESMTRLLESMEDPTPHHYVAILKAWAKTCKIAREIGKSKSAHIVGIPQRTQLILIHMGGGPNSKNNNISVEAYNEVIKAWAYSSEYLRGTMAEQVFQKIQFPTGESLRLIMRAHAWSNENRSAFQATGHFMRMMRLLEAGRDDMEPSSIDDYHILCDAWTKAGDKNSSSKVYSVLQIMSNAYEKGHTNIRADLKCYRDALITMSRRQNVEDVGYLADETLKEMKDQMIFPDSKCYRAAILAWKNVAMSRDCLYPEQAIRRTQELLQEMTEAYHRTAQILIQPTTEDYNHVLQSMNLSKSSQVVDYARDLFQTLKDETSSTGGPDAHSYRYMLGILCNCRSPDKFSHSLQLLREVTDSYKNDESWRASKSSKESTMDVFTAFVRVCGSPATNFQSQQDRTKKMTTALRVLEDSTKLGLTLNSDTYTALVEACDNLLPVNGRERENVLSNIFCRACDEGFVNQSLLESFKSASSTYLYAKLVVSKSMPMEDIKIVPESWTRNVVGHKEGKQVMPLSIHGSFTFTKSAAEYRMRKLRKRTNQKFLRGGRLK